MYTHIAAAMAKLVNALASETSVERLMSSSLIRCTIFYLIDNAI